MTHKTSILSQPCDTVVWNQQNNTLNENQNVWLFGYGSLIFNVDFPFIEQRPAFIKDWVRRFWQGSHDHRGTPEAPGRVVTLVPEPHSICHGMAYLVAAQTFKPLDIREKNGYLRLPVTLTFTTPSHSSTQGLTYIAQPNNSAYLGPASEKTIAQDIAKAKGPSGSNQEYLLQLAKALRQLSAEDAHVFTIEKYLNEIVL